MIKLNQFINALKSALKQLDDASNVTYQTIDINDSKNINFQCTSNSGIIKLNGKTYDGNILQIRNGKIYVDGELQSDDEPKDCTFIINSDVSNVVTQNLVINGNANGRLDGMDITINGNFQGDIDGMNVTVYGDHTGSIDATSVEINKK